MIATITITCCSIVLMFVSLMVFPEAKIKGKSFETFFIGPLLGAVIILCFGLIDYSDLGKSLIQSGSINPLEILALFLSMSFLSIVLDEAGFFSYLACKVANKSKGSQYTLFFLLYALTSILTIFTSNDIVILTFTPFIIFFTKRAKISPIPFLVSEFVASNTYSMLLLIGNPTNIYLAESFNIGFFEYFSKMWLATILSGVAGLVSLLVIFRKKLKASFAATEDHPTLKDPVLALVSLVILGLTIIMMAVSDFVSIPLWLVSVVGALFLIVFVLFYGIKNKRSYRYLGNSFLRLPYPVIPFILSMFVLVLSLKDAGVIKIIANYLSNINPYLGVGLISFIGADFLNNIPMSVFFTEVISSMSTYNSLNVYLAIISSNIGAYLTPVGALAGVMWMSILKNHEIKFGFLDFIKYLSPISIISLVFAFLGLFLVNLL